MQGLEWNDYQAEGFAKVKSPHISLDPLNVAQPGALLARNRQHLASEVEPDHRDASTRQREADAAGSGADLERAEVAHFRLAGKVEVELDLAGWRRHHHVVTKRDVRVVVEGFLGVQSPSP